MTTAEMIDCKGLPPGSLLEVETKNRQYHIECLGGSAIRISGHPEYCPEPVDGHVTDGLIERGRYLQFLLKDHRAVTTSRIVRLRVLRPPQSTSVH